MRLIILVLCCVSFVFGQQKKVLVAYPNLAQELETVNSGAKIIAVTPSDAIEQIADADAYIGNITSAEVRAGKNLKWVGVMSAGVENVL